MDCTVIDSLDAAVPDAPTDSIVSHTVHDDEDAKVVLFVFAPGQELSEHTAARPAVLHILRGEADLTLGGARHDASTGTWVHMPPNTPHSIRARSQVRMLLTLL